MKSTLTKLVFGRLGRKTTAIAFTFAALAVGMGTATAGTISDEIVLDSSIYGHFDVTIPEGDEVAGLFIGGSPIFGAAINIYLTDPGTNIISDHLYSNGGSQTCDENGNGGDCIFFSSDSSVDPSIGTLCIQFCVEETGELQDVSSLVAPQNDGQGIFDSGTIQVESAPDTPEPASLTLMGLGLAGFAVRKLRLRSAR